LQIPLLPRELAGRQLELDAPSRAVDGVQHTAPHDPRQGSLPYTGVMPGAKFRKPDSGEHVNATQLDLQLDGIYMRRGRASQWNAELAASRIMTDLRAQTYGARELGDRVLGLPPWARGRWDLTPNQEKVLAALWVAYRDETCGVFELETTLASDLGFSERTLRNALNGRRWKRKDGTIGESMGLVEMGLAVKRQTWKAGTADGRPSEHDWLLLRIGPAFEAYARPLVFEIKAPPRRSGYTKSAARQAARLARKQARELRYARATEAYATRRRRDVRDATRIVEQRSSSAALVAALSGAAPESVERRWTHEPSRADAADVWHPSRAAAMDASRPTSDDASQLAGVDALPAATEPATEATAGVRLEQGCGAAGPFQPEALGRRTPLARAQQLGGTRCRQPRPGRDPHYVGGPTAKGFGLEGACGPAPLLESDAGGRTAEAAGSPAASSHDGDARAPIARPVGAGAPAQEPCGPGLPERPARAGWLRPRSMTFADRMLSLLDRAPPELASAIRTQCGATSPVATSSSNASPLQRDDANAPPDASTTSTSDGYAGAMAKLEELHRAGLPLFDHPPPSSSDASRSPAGDGSAGPATASATRSNSDAIASPSPSSSSSSSTTRTRT
jgi:hypothetical protein